MIEFLLKIANPFAKDIPHKHYISIEKSVTKHKFFRVECYKSSPYNILNLIFDSRWRGSDHAGIMVGIEIFGYCFEIALQDKRHWDYENGCWEIYDDSE